MSSIYSKITRKTPWGGSCDSPRNDGADNRYAILQEMVVGWSNEGATDRALAYTSAAPLTRRMYQSPLQAMSVATCAVLEITALN